MTDLIRVLVDSPVTVLVSDPAASVTLAVGLPGPPGPAGAPGTPGSGDPGDYLQTALRLAEFADDSARAAARANLGLATIDGGTFTTATP